MPQLRQDPTTKEWVIIASERLKRPHAFKKTEVFIEKPCIAPHFSRHFVGFKSVEL